MSKAVVVEELAKVYVVKRGFFRRRIERVEALRGVSFSVDRGCVYGLLGPNGAGKTTTVKILSTLLLPDRGCAWVLGYSVLDEPARVREVIGVSLSVERGFFWKLTGYENLKYFGMLRGLHGDFLEKRIDYVMDVVGLKKLGGHRKFFEEYSLGMKARLSIARALLHNPEVLILDEPTLGLDPHSARHIRELLVKLAKEEGKSVLITSHNMFEVEMICDRVAIINEGRIIVEGPIPDLKKLVSKEIPVVIEAWRHGLTSSYLSSILHERLGVSVGVSIDDNGLTRVKALVPVGEEDRFIHMVVDILHSLGAKIRLARTEEPSLEDVFIKLTGGMEWR